MKGLFFVNIYKRSTIIKCISKTEKIERNENRKRTRRSNRKDIKQTMRTLQRMAGIVLVKIAWFSVSIKGAIKTSLEIVVVYLKYLNL